MWHRSQFRSPTMVRSVMRSNNRPLHFEALEDRTAPASLGAINSAADPPAGQGARAITVMTRNLYVGADLSPLSGAVATGDPSAIIGAVFNGVGRGVEHELSRASRGPRR